MNFIRNLFSQKTLDKGLFGKWCSDENDDATMKAFGIVTMTFTPDGKLIYEITEGEKLQVINMIFWTEGNIIVSDQPSSPRKERTQYSFDSEGYLILESYAQRAKFIKKLY